MPSGTQAGSITGWQPFSNKNMQQNHLEDLFKYRLLGLIFRNSGSVGLGGGPRISISKNPLVTLHVAGLRPHTWRTTVLEQSSGETRKSNVAMQKCGLELPNLLKFERKFLNLEFSVLYLHV